MGNPGSALWEHRQRVVRKGEPTVVNDLRRDERHYDKSDDETQSVTRSILAVPYIRREKVIGASVMKHG